MYHRMSSDSLLQRICSMETLKMQKSASTPSYGRGVFVGKSRVEATASMAISTFNEGASAILTVMERLWLQTTVVTVGVMREICSECPKLRPSHPPLST